MPRPTRRQLLAGLGALGAGAGFFHPFMRAATAAEPSARRFVIVVEGNCIEPISFLSESAQDAAQASASSGYDLGTLRWAYNRVGHSAMLETQGDLGTALALDPLLAGADQSDLSEKAAVLLGLSSRITNGGHSSHFGALSSTRSSSSRPAGPTIDAWLAAQSTVRGSTPFDCVRVGVGSSGAILSNATCAFGEGRSAPVSLDPGLSYGNLFGFVPGSSGAGDFYRKSLQLDFAIDDVNAALATFPGNSRERAKLEAYLSSLEAVKTRQQRLQEMATALSEAGTPFPAPEDPSTNPLYATGDHFDVLEAQMDNVAAALLGGLTNVAVVTSGTGGEFGYMRYTRVLQEVSGIEPDLGRHDLHHLSGGASESNVYADAIHQVTREHVSLIARLARTLDAVPEGDGTMLDHTAILYLSDNGEQHHSTGSEWPTLLLGGGALGLNTGGRTLHYPGVEQAENRQLSNLFNTLGYAAGVPLDDFGGEGETRIATGPLDALLT
ncbi:MAG: DUF1552 domain-containing protein [Myxococcota bacterium]|nr:DUF1552 domain-containing protein [Myxococcota bacterium]